MSTRSTTAARPTVEPAYFSTQVSRARRFYLRLAPDRARSLTVISGGWELCRPDYQIQRPGFPHPALEFVANGAGDLVMGGRHVPLAPGSVFVYGRSVPHEIACRPGAPMLKYFVVFAGPAARPLLRGCRLPPGATARVARPERIREVFDELIDHALGDRLQRERFAAACLAFLLARVALWRLSETAAADRAAPTYERCRAFIEAHAAGLRRLDEIAAACHVSPAHICRLFRRFGRESPMRFLRHLQMNLAAERLLAGGRSVKEIAVDFGFSDPHNFSRAFRRAFGVAPSRLRPA